MWYRTPSQKARRFTTTSRIPALQGTRLAAGFALQAKHVQDSIPSTINKPASRRGVGESERACQSPTYASPQVTLSNAYAPKLQPPPLAVHGSSAGDSIQCQPDDSSPDSAVLSLLTQGSPGEGAQLALTILSKGGRLRHETLHKTVSCLLDPEKLGCQVVGPANRTTLAIRLLSCARGANFSPRKETYQAVIEKCISNGDVLEATTLFAALARSWQAYQEELNQPRSQRAGGKEHTTYPRPSYTMLRPIIDSIQDGLERVTQTSGASERWRKLREALAVLVDLANKQLLPFSRLSSFIKACHGFRQHLRTVRARNVLIGNYTSSRDDHVDSMIHDCLTRFIQRLVPSELETQLLDLHLNTCNALLYYALRFCRSQELASTVLEYMFEYRTPVLQLELSTYNVLLRSSTLLKHNSFAKLVMETWNGQAGKADLRKIAAALRTETNRKDKGPLVAPPSVDPAMWQSSENDIRSCATSLVTYITHWTSVGKPEEIVKFIYQLFPGIDFSQLISRHSATLDRSISHEYFTSVRRAAHLGPHVVSAILNSAAKTGKIGLVEKLWHLALQAEIASWDCSLSDNYSPWRLSIHSFTSVLQLYASEKRRGSSISSFHSFHRRAKGWGGELEGLPCIQAAQIMAERIYSSREYRGPRELHAPDGIRLVNMPNSLSDPTPDTQFFISALDVFEDPYSAVKGLPKKLGGNRRARNYLNLSLKSFLKQGYTRLRPGTLVRRVLSDMRRYKQDIPVRYLPR